MIDFRQLMAQDTLTGVDSEVYLVLNASDVGLTDDQFFRLCRDNDDFHIEMSGEGELIIMSPNRPKTGKKHARLIVRLGTWADADGRELRNSIVHEYLIESSDEVLRASHRRAPELLDTATKIKTYIEAKGYIG